MNFRRRSGPEKILKPSKTPRSVLTLRLSPLTSPGSLKPRPEKMPRTNGRGFSSLFRTEESERSETMPSIMRSSTRSNAPLPDFLILAVVSPRKPPNLLL